MNILFGVLGFWGFGVMGLAVRVHAIQLTRAFAFRVVHAAGPQATLRVYLGVVEAILGPVGIRPREVLDAGVLSGIIWAAVQRQFQKSQAVLEPGRETTVGTGREKPDLIRHFPGILAARLRFQAMHAMGFDVHPVNCRLLGHPERTFAEHGASFVEAFDHG